MKNHDEDMMIKIAGIRVRLDEGRRLASILENWEGVSPDVQMVVDKMLEILLLMRAESVDALDKCANECASAGIDQVPARHALSPGYVEAEWCRIVDLHKDDMMAGKRSQ